jgi:acyl-CoA thioesterase
MNPDLKAAIIHAVESEPFAKLLDMRLVHLEVGRSVVEMVYRPDQMGNIQGRAHGGAIYALIDEALEAAAHTDGTRCAALTASVTYIASPTPGSCLRAEARRIAGTRKTISLEARVTDPDGTLIAICQGLAYRTGKPLLPLPE